MASRKRKQKQTLEEAYEEALRLCQSLLEKPPKPRKKAIYEFHYDPVTGVRNYKSRGPYKPSKPPTEKDVAVPSYQSGNDSNCADDGLASFSETIRKGGTTSTAVSKQKLKVCESCGQSCPTAVKRCKNQACGSVFHKKSRFGGIKDMGMTNPSKQRELLEYRANVLRVHHKWDVIVLYRHIHSKGTTVGCFGTPGLGASFIGKDREEPSTSGEAVKNLFKHYKYSQQDASDLQAPSSSLLPESTSIQPSTAAALPIQPSSNTITSQTSSSKTVTPQTSSSKTVTPQTSSSNTITARTSSSKTVTAKTSSSKTVTPQTSSSNTVTPQTSSLHIITARTSSSNTITPQTSSSKTVTPKTSSPNTITPQTSSSKTVTPQTSSSNTITPQTSSSNTVSPEPSSCNTITPQTSSSNTITPQPSSSETVTPQTSSSNTITPQTSSSNTITPQTSSNTITPQTSSSETVTPQTSSFNTITPQTSSNTFSPQVSTTATLSTNTAQLVAYVKDGSLLASGYPFPSRKLIHGEQIPPSYVCVQLTFARDGIRSPCILGDKDKNRFLANGMFFALPVSELFTTVPGGSTTKLLFRPFSLS